MNELKDRLNGLLQVYVVLRSARFRRDRIGTIQVKNREL